jgi:FKBP-type peptidyl-prolyl cis-trans isomerase (trigger factor)
MMDIKKLDKSRVEITGELAVDIFEGYRARALAHLGAHVEVAGFRKGHIPENILLKNIPENMLHEEMAEMALAEHYPKILTEQKLDAIGRPEIVITKLAKDNPLGFKITATVLPEVKLPDYKKIAVETRKEKIELEVTNKDIEDTILQLRRMRAHDEIHKTMAPDDHTHDPVKDEDLPEFNDEYVTTLGDFKTVEEFKTKLRENLALEKEREAVSSMRYKIAEAIIKETKVDVPEILIDSEFQKMFTRLRDDVAKANIEFADYLKHINKTEDDIKKEWEPDSLKKATLELIIFEIAKKEGITPNPEQVESEAQALIKHYAGADPDRARAYVAQALTHEMVFALLEKE